MLFKQKKSLNVVLTSSAVTLVLLAGCVDEYRDTKYSTAISHKAVDAEPIALKPNTPPVANAGEDQLVRVGEVVTLDASKSTDPDHDLLTFTWEQTSGPVVEIVNANTLAPSFIAPPSKEPLTFALTVDDGRDASKIDSVNISIANRTPFAHAGRTIIAKHGSKVSLDGSSSIDPDNDELNYQWTQVFGQKVELEDSTSISPSFTMPDTSGYLIFALTVSDATDQSIADTVAVKVSNTPPIAKIKPATDNYIAGKRVQLDGTESYDADGDPLSFQWSQILGTPVMLQNAKSATPEFIAPNRPDHLVFELSVNDGEFSSHPVSQVVSIKTEIKSFEPSPNATKAGKVDVDSGLTPVKKNKAMLKVK